VESCCLAKQELEDARRELQTWWPDLDFAMPLYDLIRQARERERTAWKIIHPIAEELRIYADVYDNDVSLAVELRRLADLLDP
jgi:hypothetical protein